MISWFRAFLALFFIEIIIDFKIFRDIKLRILLLFTIRPEVLTAPSISQKSTVFFIDNFEGSGVCYFEVDFKRLVMFAFIKEIAQYCYICGDMHKFKGMDIEI